MLHRASRLYLILVAAVLFLMAYQGRHGPLRPLGFLATAIDNMNYSVLALKTSARDTVGKITVTEKELAYLKEEVRRLGYEVESREEMLREHDRLLESLALKERSLDYVATARVVSRGSGRWSNTFVIDKGADDGLQKDMAVMTPAGLLGKLSEVRQAFSTVLLVDDSLFSVAVRLRDSRVEGVLSGDGPGECVLKYVEATSPVRKGDEFVTSGMDGMFPAGLVVGRVTKIKTLEDELFHEIDAVPFASSRRVEEVTIIKR